MKIVVASPPSHNIGSQRNCRQYIILYLAPSGSAGMMGSAPLVLGSSEGALQSGKISKQQVLFEGGAVYRTLTGFTSAKWTSAILFPVSLPPYQA
jgi:hypothetical protein